ncbi:BZ3500_MvSof-1268-A1-R1_Chr2-1g04671 [Microbotryum saponariae]|uniref:GID complex catalytic subunit 2 n=1 Tax=Microbotryum saponariae TaxID=289078 RepID=A0A2X0KGD7_9BASI|nr:BZ3500_MvSof-1268-A1-R1_Chr2-1g04671 [Microbotryum saponariae]SCZ92279.1 BZ3501_MvSof-1269-A2-R1_Chr2-1g04327 [Microbotryum saponariae]
MEPAATYLEPLGSELSYLTSTAHDASELGLSHVDDIIARLERARAPLINAPDISTFSIDDDATMTTDTPSTTLSVADHLLPLSMMLKSSATAASAAHKEWSSAVSKLAKSVDKVRSSGFLVVLKLSLKRLCSELVQKFPSPPQALFPPAAQKQLATSSNSNFSEGLAPHGATAPSAQASLSISTASSTSTASLLPFGSAETTAALNSTIALHLARIGAFDSLSSLNEQTHHTVQDAVPYQLLASLKELHRILAHLKQGICTSALEWIEQTRRSSEKPGSIDDAARQANSDPDPDSDLEFELRKEEYIRLLLSTSLDDKDMAEREPLLAQNSSPSSQDKRQQGSINLALRYGGHHFRRLMTPSRRSHIEALLTAPIYMPLERLLHSPYAPIFEPYVPTESTLLPAESTPTCAMFTAAFLSTLGLPRDSPLTVVTDIGGSGAMAKIHKVRAVMKEQKTSWSAIGELPVRSFLFRQTGLARNDASDPSGGMLFQVEVPLPTNRRYHSIFACPVSKEQSTPTNPPMLLTCGHVIARESLVRLARGTPTLKCPYCPAISNASAAVRVHF